MNAAKNALARTKNFVTNHKIPITIVATAAVTMTVARKLQVAGLKEAYEFIEAKGLKDDFLNSTHIYGDN